MQTLTRARGTVVKYSTLFCREKEFQFLIATEAYEVGVHNDHVKNVYRIGTPRNLTVLLQEFGRAGRLGDMANGKYDLSAIYLIFNLSFDLSIQVAYFM